MNLSDITKEHIESIEVRCPLNDTVINLPMGLVQCRTRITNEKFVSAQLGFNCPACGKFHLSDLMPTGFLVISGESVSDIPWLPIETAPKDGSDFLALIPSNTKHRQIIGCFAPNETFVSWPSRWTYNPTHWRPLSEDKS